MNSMLLGKGYSYQIIPATSSRKKGLSITSRKDLLEKGST